ncbi:MAG: hypothetical protein KKD05_00320 [Candidatus Omnitrophica bacterium]|nr:hypothetical protein [Candidatus Omnitrophota bacterium]
MLKNSAKIIIFLGILAFLCPNRQSFGYLNVDISALSPHLNLDRTTFQSLLVKPSEDLLQRAVEFTEVGSGPDDQMGEIICKANLDGQKLIVRKRVYDFGDEIEVNNVLTVLKPDGSEEKLGQCIYVINEKQATVENKYEFEYALRIIKRGNGYGPVLFAATIENARENGLNRFLIVDPTSSLYSLFDFKQIGTFALSEKDIKPDDPSFFTIARDLNAQRGRVLRVQGLPFLGLDKAIVKFQVDSASGFLTQSI